MANKLYVLVSEKFGVGGRITNWSYYCECK